MLSCLLLSVAVFCTTMKKLNSYDKSYMAHKAYHLDLYRSLLTSALRQNFVKMDGYKFKKKNEKNMKWTNSQNDTNYQK